MGSGRPGVALGEGGRGRGNRRSGDPGWAVALGPGSTPGRSRTTEGGVSLDRLRPRTGSDRGPAPRVPQGGGRVPEGTPSAAGLPEPGGPDRRDHTPSRPSRPPGAGRLREHIDSRRPHRSDEAGGAIGTLHGAASPHRDDGLGTVRQRRRGRSAGRWRARAAGAGIAPDKLIGGSVGAPVAAFLYPPSRSTATIVLARGGVPVPRDNPWR